MLTIRKRIQIAGVVQGVGFRPFVWRLATNLGCTGLVRNDSVGVLLEVQGLASSVEEFLTRLESEAPTSASIGNIVVVSCAIKLDESGFEIADSQRSERLETQVAPDRTVCSDCLGELRDPSNRRYAYPFINCTNCGPRFTIIKSLPYARSSTTMSDFKLCDACREEYHSPSDRRFHAEPNACAVCGPKIWFTDSDEEYSEHDSIITFDTDAERDRTQAVLQSVQSRIADGQIVAIKGVGGFHLACDATNEQAVKKLRERKRRPEKPFAVMVTDLASCNEFASLSEQDARLLLSPERPIVLVEKSRLTCKWAEWVAPCNPFLGVMIAYSPLHAILIPRGQIWVMTSGNLSDEPIAIDNLDAWTRLKRIADGFLFHNRPICVECDDSVLRTIDGGVLPIRRSRGFAPLPVPLSCESDSDPPPTVLAVGGELKATICLAIGPQAFMSQHIGDMENEESQRTIERISNHLLNLYETKPDAIAADLHPGYFSLRWAEKLASQLSIPLIKTQHHHAHAVSLMAEYGIPEDASIIACVFDGTGFGSDGTIWGGEWLIASAKEFRRFAHLRSVPLPGGDRCAQYPARSALAHLFHESIEWTPSLACVQTPTASEIKRLSTQIEKRIHCTEASSMGRLFDAVSALVGVRQKNSYEGQAAIELEGLSTTVFQNSNVTVKPYPFEWIHNQSSVLMLGQMFRQMIADIESGTSPGMVGARFHETLSQAAVAICNIARSETGINTVGLSGGVFQNALLTQLMRDRLESHDFRLLVHRQVPPNDAGLALGQAVIARAHLKTKNAPR